MDYEDYFDDDYYEEEYEDDYGSGGIYTADDFYEEEEEVKAYIPPDIHALENAAPIPA
jgi:hypothetical protein